MLIVTNINLEKNENEEKKNQTNQFNHKMIHLPMIKDKKFNNLLDYKADEAYFVNTFKRCLIESKILFIRFEFDEE